MSLAEILESLHNLTFEERQQVVSTAFHIDEPRVEYDFDEEGGDAEISDQVKQILEERWRQHLAHPETALTLEQLKALMASRRRK